MPTFDAGGGWTYLGTTGGITHSTYTFNGTVTIPNWTSSNTGTFTMAVADGGLTHLPTVNYTINNTNPEEAQHDLERRIRVDQEWEQERAQRARSRTEAIERATALLLAVLDERQRESYQATETFDVIGSRGTHYRIHMGSMGNVEWLTPDGETGGRLCAHPSMNEHWLPDQDVALSQLLALTTDETAFVRLANVHRGRRPELVAA